MMKKEREREKERETGVRKMVIRKNGCKKRERENGSNLKRKKDKIVKSAK